MFCTVLHSLKSPVNVGTIVRTHVALGGSEVVFVGHRKPWSFKKASQAFSRKLERLCKLLFIEHDDDFFAWAEAHGYTTVAVEVRADARPIHHFAFPERPALVLGSESRGLSSSFLQASHSTVRIPQYGSVGSLNVATAAAIAMHEFQRGRATERLVVEGKFIGEPGAVARRLTSRCS